MNEPSDELGDEPSDELGSEPVDAPKSAPVSDLPILQRRRLEAQLLKHVHDTIEARSGRAEARAVIGQAVSNAAIEHGREFAAALGRPPTLRDFRGIMPLWTKEDALEIEVLAADEERLDFNVTRCRYAETYREMGLGEIGDLLSCNRDGDFCIGYNPAMELTRTQTIMRGATHCDFRYRLRAVEEGADPGSRDPGAGDAGTSDADGNAVDGSDGTSA